jgi:hypothetical protein
VLTLGSAAKATGHVIVDGNPETTLLTRIQEVIIGSRGLGFNPNDPNGRIGADGAFTLDGLVGQGCLDLIAPGGWYVQSATYQGRSILRVPIVFEPGAQLDDVLFTVARRVPDAEVPDPCPAHLPDSTSKN